MADKGGLVLTSQCRTEQTKWLQSLKRKENAFVVFFPKTDRLILLQQMLQDRVFLKSVLGTKEKYFFQTLDLEASYVEEKNEMRWRIADQLNYSHLTPNTMNWDEWMVYLRKHDVTLVLVLPQAEKYLTAGNSTFLSYLSDMVDTFSPRVITLSMFETDVTHSSMMRLLPSSTRLYQNIFYYPLYSKQDSGKFIEYLEDRWGKSISKAMKAKILEQCGGIQWLIKEAVRQVTSGNLNPFNEDGMQFRLRMVYEFLLPSEQSVLTKSVLHNQTLDAAEKQSLRHLQKMNFMDSHGKCLVKLFDGFVTNAAPFTGEFVLLGGKMLLNDVPVDQMFSFQERRVLKVFLQNKGHMVTRDEIAEALWPTNTQENYSDWAIDQIIARLRKRLSELSLPPKLLQAVRGKGYLLNLQSS